MLKPCYKGKMVVWKTYTIVTPTWHRLLPHLLHNYFKNKKTSYKYDSLLTKCSKVPPCKRCKGIKFINGTL